MFCHLPTSGIGKSVRYKKIKKIITDNKTELQASMGEQ